MSLRPAGMLPGKFKKLAVRAQLNRALGSISAGRTRYSTPSRMETRGDRNAALEPQCERRLRPDFGQACPGSFRIFGGTNTRRWKTARTWMSAEAQKRTFHDYFVTHLPSSSLHPDSGSAHGRSHHNLPRSSSLPHTSGDDRPPSVIHQGLGLSREMTVVRIPLQSAKFHFGSSTARGTRPYNEDMFQAGVIEIPAFAKRSPISLRRGPEGQEGGAKSAQSADGDPQVFYFGIFDGHGGSECSKFLHDSLHAYIEMSAKELGLRSTLKPAGANISLTAAEGINSGAQSSNALCPSLTKPRSAGFESNKRSLSQLSSKGSVPSPHGNSPLAVSNTPGSPTESQLEDHCLSALELQKSLIAKWGDLVGGYFKRFRPNHFAFGSGSKGHIRNEDPHLALQDSKQARAEDTTIETVLTYAFLKADLDFVVAQVRKLDDDIVRLDRALNEDDILGETSRRPPKNTGRGFKGGSTCSVALISTPTPAPFWHPASPSTLITSHVGDTRILLCNTATGRAMPMTTTHHPSSPGEENRLRRFAASFVTDSFGEERMGGLANTRAFGDIQSKRMGVSAEPEIRRLELKPAEYSFLVLVSDGVSGPLTDQEIVDIVKESKTPEQGAKNVVDFATEVSDEGDNATCLVLRLGGWERRIEGGLGSMETKEVREWKLQEAINPRSRRT
ncbi:MAG: hypothetical protein M1816_002248 [Peltula sp. TS41687]|nr:MAG: hypothetical protein M1816_002248 [Peltula sp. TS41687]